MRPAARNRVERVAGLVAPMDILIWATDPAVAEALSANLTEPGRSVRVIETDAELAACGSEGSLLVAQSGPRLEAQHSFLRGSLIVLDEARTASSSLVGRAYAVVGSPPQANLAVDRFLAHRTLAELAGRHRGPPRHCSRCGRGFDLVKARQGGTARRFVRFGSVSLCGGCVEKLRTLLRQIETAVVEADA